MAPCEGCPLRSGDWCSRLSWPGTPVTSFRWGRVATITVSPGGAASPARRDAPRRSSGIPSVRTAAPGFRRGGTPAYDGDIPRGRVRVLPGGGIRRRRGQQSRPRTRHLSPTAQKCPRTRRMSPAATPEYGASVASRATGAPTAPAPTSNHDLRAPHRRQKRPSREGAASSSGGEAPGRGVRVPDPHRSGWLTPIPAARRVRRGPPSAPGYGHRPAPAHCAGGP